MSPQLQIGLGLLGILVGFVSLYLAYRNRKVVATMEETPTTPIGRIKTAGYYEVNGKVECDTPLTIPGTDQEGVYYRLVITEQVEESYRNSRGEWDTRRTSRTVKDETNSCTFRVRDSTGAIGVLPTGATFEASEAHRRREGGHDSSWQAEMGAMVGYRTTEVQGARTQVDAVKVGQSIYAIGRVTKMRNGLFFQRDEEGDRPFILSLRSEAAQIASRNRWMTFQLVAGLILSLGGLTMFLIGLTSR